MFTGIIESIGIVTGARRQGASMALSVTPECADFEVAIGESVAVDGACLTLERREGAQMQFSAVAETLNRTTLNNVGTGRRVNLERAALVGGRIDGHLVYGHVDGTGTILRDREMCGSTLRTISVPPELSRFMAEKGSVAVDGISLTIAACGARDITISFIPYTLKATTMALKKTGDAVNLECDIVARYLHRLMQAGTAASTPAPEPLLSLMERSGF